MSTCPKDKLESLFFLLTLTSYMIAPRFMLLRVNYVMMNCKPYLQPGPLPELQTCLNNCPVDTSTWMPNRQAPLVTGPS